MYLITWKKNFDELLWIIILVCKTSGSQILSTPLNILEKLKIKWEKKEFFWHVEYFGQITLSIGVRE